MGRTNQGSDKHAELSMQAHGLLVDNGSLRPEAELFTRKMAGRITKSSGIPFEACSLDHSDRLPVAKLNGTPMPLLENRLRDICRDPRFSEIYVLPFVLVTGGAIYRKAEGIVNRFAARYPGVRLVMGKALLTGDPESEFGVVDMIEEQVRTVLEREALLCPRVILVDHGSPGARSANVRNAIAAELETRLGRRVERVIPASMERRPGKQYDFNEPLLKRALESAVEEDQNRIILARLFLQPGRHAGVGGDIDQICREVAGKHEELKIFPVSRVFPQKKLTRVLIGRLNELREHAQQAHASESNHS